MVEVFFFSEVRGGGVQDCVALRVQNRFNGVSC